MYIVTQSVGHIYIHKHMARKFDFSASAIIPLKFLDIIFKNKLYYEV